MVPGPLVGQGTKQKLLFGKSITDILYFFLSTLFALTNAALVLLCNCTYWYFVSRCNFRPAVIFFAILGFLLLELITEHNFEFHSS